MLPARLAAVGLQTRLLLATILVLALGLGAVGWMLDRSHKAAVRSGAEQQLRTTAYGIYGAAKEQDGGIVVETQQVTPRLQRAESGLFAFVEVVGQGVVWRSPSAAVRGFDLPTNSLPRRPAPGEHVFARESAARFVFGYTVIWEPLQARATIWVFADRAPYREQIAGFRRNAALGLLGVALAFVVAQFAAVRWGFAPLRRMVARIGALEAGVRSDIGHDYPAELSGLARNFNRFIAYERANRERYRLAMDDLAHSLKTPLAVLQNATRDLRRDSATVVREQLQRMERTVAHQLARAVAARPVLPAVPLAVLPLAERITRALQRAYAEKGIVVDAPWQNGTGPAPGVHAVRVEESEAMDMLGNLIENAFKYARSRVRISAAATAGGVETVVEDDGDGIPAAKRALVLQRGARADDATSGQGIGLAVVVELASTYGGRLTLDESDLGGVAARLELPSAKATGEAPERRHGAAVEKAP